MQNESNLAAEQTGRKDNMSESMNKSENIRGIVLDIDGTLTNSQKKITPRTLKALQTVQDQGVRLILASGRTPQGMADLVHELQMDQHHGLVISYNGAKVSDAQSQEVLFFEPIDAKDVRRVLEHLKKFDAVPIIDKDEYMYVEDVFNNTIEVNGKPWNVLQYESRGNHYLLAEKPDLAEFADFPVAKILTYGSPADLQAQHEAIAAPFVETLSCMFTAPFYFEFTAKGIDKKKALEAVCEKEGLQADELMAFGDAQNDHTMLEHCKIGIAMGNAVDSLKAAADEITLSNDEDGIAESLERHFPEWFR